MTTRKCARRVATAFCALVAASMADDRAAARSLAITVEDIPRIPQLRPSYPVPAEPDMLFYVQRSVNANTVVYCAPRQSRGTAAPVEVFWRLYNIDGHTRPLNFIERLLAYGVHDVVVRAVPALTSFRIAAIPELELRLATDAAGRPSAIMSFGDRPARLVYVYLQVDDHGIMPRVTALDLFGIEQGSGQALHEHVIPQ